VENVYHLRNSKVPKYSVIAHHRVHKFLKNIVGRKFKQAVLENIVKLEDYPLSLEIWT
jgi:hypothetical protein